MPDQTTVLDPTHPHGAPKTDGSAVQVRQAYAKLPAQDIDRARAFYEATLGLQPCGEHNRHLHYELGGAYFIIFPSTGAASGTHDQLGFVVDDIEHAVARLKAEGVTLEDYQPPPGATQHNGITDLGAVKAAWFKDSEGNLISLAEFPTDTPFNRTPSR